MLGPRGTKRGTLVRVGARLCARARQHTGVPEGACASDPGLAQPTLVVLPGRMQGIAMKLGHVSFY
jgi:hypothetical protein